MNRDLKEMNFRRRNEIEEAKRMKEDMSYLKLNYSYTFTVNRSTHTRK